MSTSRVKARVNARHERQNSLGCARASLPVQARNDLVLRALAYVKGRRACGCKCARMRAWPALVGWLVGWWVKPTFDSCMCVCVSMPYVCVRLSISSLSVFIHKAPLHYNSLISLNFFEEVSTETVSHPPQGCSRLNRCESQGLFYIHNLSMAIKWASPNKLKYSAVNKEVIYWDCFLFPLYKTTYIRLYIYIDH